jgi:hypothetical protein
MHVMSRPPWSSQKDALGIFSWANRTPRLAKAPTTAASQRM